MTAPIRWLPVPNFPQYEIASNGKLRSWRRKARVWREPRSEVRDAPVVVTGTVTPLGYVAYIVRKPGDRKPYRRMAHRLVALAFLPNPNGHAEVAHNDGDPSNNHVNNLRWCTHRDNQMDMRRHSTMQDGEKSTTAKVTAEQAAEIRKRAHKRGEGIRLAAEFGLSKAQISRIKNGKRWRSL